MSASEPAPQLSVIVPVLDEERCLPRLLQRLLGAPARADRADELVVVDGGSCDASAELARAAGARVLAAPRGRGAQLAAGARAARGELLWFLHADCVPAPGALAALRRRFDEPALAAAACAQRIEAEARIYRWIERAADRRARAGMVYGDSGLCLRRALYERAGGFAELPLFEDVELSERLRALARVEWVGEAVLQVSARRWQREGVLRRTLSNWMLRCAWTVGVPAQQLARWYAPHADDNALQRRNPT